MSFRILHTSDWHLGHTFHGYERAYEHQRFLSWLLECLEEERPDALVLAGDVFDVANPSAAAQRDLFGFLSAARRRLPRLSSVLIAGNHDSAGRVEAPAAVLEAVGTRVIGQPRRAEDGGLDAGSLVLPLPNREGAVGAWCVAIPFLRPSEVLTRTASGAAAYDDAVVELCRRAVTLAVERRGPDQPLIAVGHCHVRGGQVSADSERAIVVGGAESLPSEAFDERLSYVALGHLHRAQQIGADARIRYSGSPLPMSFAEQRYEHSVVIVDFDGSRLTRVRPRRVPRFVDLLRVPAEPRPLAEVLRALEALPKSDFPENERPYLEVRVLLDHPEPTLRSLIEGALAGRAVRLARIEAVHAGAAGRGASLSSPEEFARLDPTHIFERRYLDDYPGPVPDALLRAFQELLIGLEPAAQ